MTPENPSIDVSPPDYDVAHATTVKLKRNKFTSLNVLKHLSNVDVNWRTHSFKAHKEIGSPLISPISCDMPQNSDEREPSVYKDGSGANLSELQEESSRTSREM